MQLSHLTNPEVLQVPAFCVNVLFNDFGLFNLIEQQYHIEQQATPPDACSEVNVQQNLFWILKSYGYVSSN